MVFIRIIRHHAALVVRLPLLTFLTTLDPITGRGWHVRAIGINSVCVVKLAFLRDEVFARLICLALHGVQKLKSESLR